MRLFFILMCCLLTTLGFCQIDQPARWEQELKFSEESYSIVSLHEEGLALIRDTEDYEHGKRKWELILLDSSLQQTWLSNQLIEAGYDFVGYEHTTGKLNLMFRRQVTESLAVIVLDIDLATKEVHIAELEVKLQIRLTHYTVADGNSVFGGYVGMEPVLIIFDPVKNKNFIVPGFFLTETELLDVRPNKNNTFNVLLAQRIAGKKKLIFRTFDKNGNILVEDEIAIDEERTILSGASSILEHDEVLIAGSFAFRNNKQASGIFSCLIDPFSEQPVLYTEFTQLQHFLDYLSDKKANKIREKATQRESYGKNSEFKTNVGIHRIDEFKGGFALFGEAFIVSSASGNSFTSANPYNYPFGRTPGVPYPYSGAYNRYYNNPYLYQPATSSVEMRMVQGFVIGFNYKGQRLWDYTVPMDELKAFSREQVADVAMAAGVPHFLYKEENELKFSNHGTDTLQTQEAKSIPIRLKNTFEESKSDDVDEGYVRQWYSKHFYAWGVTTIKDLRPSMPNRRVFYINKITLLD